MGSDQMKSLGEKQRRKRTRKNLHSSKKRIKNKGSLLVYKNCHDRLFFSSNAPHREREGFVEMGIMPSI
jgi:hypothetical protein